MLPQEEIGIPIAAQKVITLFLIIFPPVSDRLFRTFTDTDPTQDTIMYAIHSFPLFYHHRFHRTGKAAAFTANTFLAVYNQPINEWQPAAERIQQILYRSYRAQKIAKSAAAFSKDTKQTCPQNNVRIILELKEIKYPKTK